MFFDHLLLAIFWGFFCVFHSVLASLEIKAILKTSLGKNFIYYRLFYTLFAFVSFALVIVYQFSIASTALFVVTAFSSIAGGFVAGVGLIIMLICIKKYFIGLSGLRSLMQEETYKELHVSGIHKYMRHPLYLGTFLFIWGLLILFPTLSLLISNAIITIYTLIGIKLEEHKLILDFGDQYKRYQKEVPKLIPRI